MTGRLPEPGTLGCGHARRELRGRVGTRFLGLLFLVPVGACAFAVDFRQQVEPVLKEYCYDCHGDGAKKGRVAFDEFNSDADRLARRDLWLAVLKNTRANLMPPAGKPRPSTAQQILLEQWIKGSVFAIHPEDPDPGRVTIRRLNRVEYRNTIRDLMGYDFKVEDELPPDDTGFGFDNIGDVLTVSPMLLEKYMQAAEIITAAAVPRRTRVVGEEIIAGSAFRPEHEKGNGERLSFYEKALVRHPFQARVRGTYRIALEVEVLGQFDFDPGRCRVTWRADGEALEEHEFGWQNGRKFKFETQRSWEAGEHALELRLEPLTGVERKKNTLDLRIIAVRVQGPTEEAHWVRPKNFNLFFAQDPPAGSSARRQYAGDVLRRFVKRAYRRPPDEKSIQRLIAIAEETAARPGKRFEDGIAQAMIPVLASPRFLFRVEEVEPASGSGTRYPLVDEYALASRLSYFLWSTMPDDELITLADRHELRAQLAGQVQRMLRDPRGQALIENFVGQWLQARDVEGIDINVRAVQARDAGEEREFERRRRRFQELVAIPVESRTPEQKEELQRMFARRLNNQNLELDRDLRRALRQEAELCFAHVLREDRSALELIESDYTFLNEKLAKHYGLTNVTGPEMRLVRLPDGSPRGGILTQGAMLIVTSNPTRTSPVKRGLFLLDNILGTPTPPPPADVPQLEEAEKEFHDRDRQPTLRETLEIHRRKPLCHSCHNRMDPLGLALENFNALGAWREKERNQTIEAGGTLITGETFRDVRELKRVLVTRHALDFYRCLTEKLLTYALGRGLEYYDVQAVDEIVERLARADGKMMELVTGIVESAPFQKRRRSAEPGPDPANPTDQRAELKTRP